MLFLCSGVLTAQVLTDSTNGQQLRSQIIHNGDTTSIYTTPYIYDQQQALAMQRKVVQTGDTVGIYAETGYGYEQMNSIKFENQKVNALGSAFSFGIAKTNMRLVFRGATSPYQFVGQAHFRIYFGIVPPEKAARLYMFSNNYTIRDFAVAKFKVKKNKRELIQGSYSLFGGMETGLQTDDSVVITTRQIRDGVYDVVVKAEAGEYCFVFTNSGAGGAAPVFDFTIK